MESSLMISWLMRARVQAHEGERLLDNMTRPLGVI
jgi:hypothetical protein